MTQGQSISEAVTLLQGLGLKEYEARCFVALTQLSSGTAKEISDISEVPRTRVYDAIDLLEAQGLVAVQHSNPKQFRAVGIDEATDTLRQKHEDRIDTLESHLRGLEPPEQDDGQFQRQEVWSLTGVEAIQNRTEDTIAETESELLLLVVDEALLTDGLTKRLKDAQDRDVTVIVGGATETIVNRVREILPGVEVFATELEWLLGADEEEEVAISRVLLADRGTLVVGSFHPYEDDIKDEQAIFATGLGNGVVVLLRRLIATGLLPERDPGM